jgi:hypothetical protein
MDGKQADLRPISSSLRRKTRARAAEEWVLHRKARKEHPMIAPLIQNASMSTASAGGSPPRHGGDDVDRAHQLRFSSLFQPGRGVVVPCDARGEVNLDALTDRLRNAYLGARAMIGREYGFPTVERQH